jgi:2-polyprenyl-3-methyl-5-hydroxy-6-metoxy-1,4-benzoquinol methylase
MTVDAGYCPEVCDLCGSTDSVALLGLNTKRSMRSDRGIVSSYLSKLECVRCGLVRSGQGFTREELQQFYALDYQLGLQPEHYFYTDEGAVSRSQLLCDWLVCSMGIYHWRRARHCLEISPGSGLLMELLADKFRDASFEGIELNHDAAQRAHRRGLAVHQGCLEDFDGKSFDLVYAITVIEHVASPTHFLNQIRAQLRSGGKLYLAQPSQDVASYDVFFCDHLHHFGTEHLRQYATKCGFVERGMVLGHEWMPNFSLHCWEAATEGGGFSWQAPPARTTCASTAAEILFSMRKLNATLDEMAAGRRRVAVFGLSEAYWLANAYSNLADFPIVCGMDDMPHKPEYQQLNFPVVRPEEGPSMQVQDVLLTMNKVYYPIASERLQRIGVRVYPVL